MKTKEWIHCDRCERVFEAEISESPKIEAPGEECIKDAGLLPGDFLANFQTSEYSGKNLLHCRGGSGGFYK